MNVFLDDHAEDMNNPEYAYQFGRNERELEIIKLLEGLDDGTDWIEIQLDKLIALIKGEK